MTEACVHGADVHGPAAPCRCGSCGPDELPVNPFLALRVAYGMLLGENEFATLMGNPRGKHMLHGAWLHRSGVVWGLHACTEGERVLRVGRGLALDGLGRELRRETEWCRDVRAWLEERDTLPDPEPNCRTAVVHACLVAELDCRTTAPVPTLADPCDVTRRHDADSRIEEGARIVLREGHCPPERPGPCATPPYHRVRVLLGLDEVGADDEAGAQARAARVEVAGAPAHERPAALLTRFRAMAALDVSELEPPPEPGERYPSLFPVLDDDAGVVLAAVAIEFRGDGDCLEVVDVRVDAACRTALLPTATIQELTCGLAPGLIDTAAPDAGGPRVVDEVPEWSAEDATFRVTVTAPLHEGTVRRRALRMTSLPRDGRDGWVDEDVESVAFDADRSQLVIRMSDRPAHELVRLVVVGTGSRPILGAEPLLPLAGLVGDPPAPARHGRDAVLVFANPALPAAPAAATPSAATPPHPTVERRTEP